MWIVPKPGKYHKKSSGYSSLAAEALIKLKDSWNSSQRVTNRENSGVHGSRYTAVPTSLSSLEIEWVLMQGKLSSYVYLTTTDPDHDKSVWDFQPEEVPLLAPIEIRKAFAVSKLPPGAVPLFGGTP